jgi:hypothetical protein
MGDPLEKATRVWILLEALRLRKPAAPHKLGVTMDMLRWIVKELEVQNFGIGECRTFRDRHALKTAILFGFFFLCRAGEYVQSGKPTSTKYCGASM